MKKPFLRLIAVVLVFAQLADPRLVLAIPDHAVSTPSTLSNVCSTQALNSRLLWLFRPSANTQRATMTRVLRKLTVIGGSAAVVAGTLTHLWQMAQETVTQSVAHLAATPLQEIVFTHVVKHGETMSRLFGMRHYQDIADLNHLANPGHIIVNQVLKTGSVQLPGVPAAPNILAHAQVYANPMLHQLGEWIMNPSLEMILVTAGTLLVTALGYGVWKRWTAGRLAKPAVPYSWEPDLAMARDEGLQDYDRVAALRRILPSLRTFVHQNRPSYDGTLGIYAMSSAAEADEMSAALRALSEAEQRFTDLRSARPRRIHWKGESLLDRLLSGVGASWRQILSFRGASAFLVLFSNIMPALAQQAIERSEAPFAEARNTLALAEMPAVPGSVLHSSPKDAKDASSVAAPQAPLTDSTIGTALSGQLKRTHDADAELAKALADAAAQPFWGIGVQGMYERGGLADMGQLFEIGPYLDIFLRDLPGNLPVKRGAARDAAYADASGAAAIVDSDRKAMIALDTVAVRHGLTANMEKILTTQMQSILDQILANAKAGSFEGSQVQLANLQSLHDLLVAQTHQRTISAEQEAKRMAGIPVSATESPLIAKDMSPSARATMVTGKAGASNAQVTAAILDAWNKMNGLQTQAEIQKRGLRRFLPASAAIRFQPSLRALERGGGPIFGFGTVNAVPSFLRVKHLDWKAQMALTQAVGSSFSDARDQAFLQTLQTLEILYSTHWELEDHLKAFNAASAAATDSTRPILEQVQNYQEALEQLALMTDAEERRDVVMDILQGFGFNVEDLVSMRESIASDIHEKMANAAAERIQVLAQAGMETYLKKNAEGMVQWLKRHLSKKNAQQQAYLAEQEKLLKLGQEPIDVAGVLKAHTIPTSDVTPVSDADAATAPEFAIKELPKVPDQPAAKLFTVDRLDPSASWLSKKGPLPSTPDSTVIAANKTTATFPWVLHFRLNAFSLKKRQKAYADALKLTQAALDANKNNLQLRQQAMDTITYNSYVQQIGDLQARLTALQGTDGYRPEVVYAIQGQIDELRTMKLHLEKNTKPDLDHTADGLPVGFDPEALLRGDMLRIQLNETVANLGSAKDVNLAVGHQQAGNKIAYDYFELGLEQIIRPLFDSIPKLIHFKHKEAALDLAVQEALLNAEGHVIAVRDKLKAANDRAQFYADRAGLAEQAVHSAELVAADTDLAPAEHITAANRVLEAKKKFAEAKRLAGQSEADAAMVTAEAQPFIIVFTKNPSDTEFKNLFKNDPASIENGAGYKKRFQSVYDKTAKGLSYTQRVRNLEIEVAKLTATVNSTHVVGSDLSIGFVAADTNAPGTSNLITDGERASATIDPLALIPHHNAARKEAAAAKAAEHAAQDNQASALMQIQSIRTSGNALISTTLAQLHDRVAGALAKAPSNTPRDRAAALALLQNLQSMQFDYDQPADASLPIHPALQEVGNPFIVHIAKDPGEVAARIVKEIEATVASSKSPLSFPIFLDLFNQHARLAGGTGSYGFAFATTQNIVDKVHGAIKGKKVSKAQLKAARLKATAARNELQRQIEMLLSSNEQGRNEIISVEQQSYSLAVSNLDQELVYLANGDIDPADINPAVLAYAKAAEALIQKQTELLMQDAQFMQLAGYEPGPVDAVKAAQAGVMSAPIDQPPNVAATAIISPAELQRNRQMRAHAKALVGSGSTRQTRKEIDDFMQSSRLAEPDFDALMAVERVVPFNKVAATATDLERRTAFFANLRLADTLIRKQHPELKSPAEAYRWGGASDKNLKAVALFYQSQEPALTLGRSVLAEGWTPEVETHWLENLGGSLGSKDWTMFRFVGDAVKESPESLPLLRQLIAQTPLDAFDTLHIFVQREYAWRTQHLPLSHRLGLQTFRLSSATLLTHLRMTLLLMQTAKAGGALPDAAHAPSVLTQALTLSINIKDDLKSPTYRRRFAAHPPTDAALDDALTQASLELTVDKLRGHNLRSLRQAASLVTAYTASLIDHRPVEWAPQTQASPHPKKRRGKFLGRLVAPLILFTTLLGGAQALSQSAPQVVPVTQTTSSPATAEPAQRPSLDERLVVLQNSRSNLLKTIHLEASVISKLPVGQNRRNVLTKDLYWTVYQLLLLYPQERKEVVSWKEMEGFPWGDYDQWADALTAWNAAHPHVDSALDHPTPEPKSPEPSSPPASIPQQAMALFAGLGLFRRFRRGANFRTPPTLQASGGLATLMPFRLFNEAVVDTLRNPADERALAASVSALERLVINREVNRSSKPSLFVVDVYALRELLGSHFDIALRYGPQLKEIFVDFPEEFLTPVLLAQAIKQDLETHGQPIATPRLKELVSSAHPDQMEGLYRYFSMDPRPMVKVVGFHLMAMLDLRYPEDPTISDFKKSLAVSDPYAYQVLERYIVDEKFLQRWWWQRFLIEEARLYPRNILISGLVAFFNLPARPQSPPLEPKDLLASA